MDAKAPQGAPADPARSPGQVRRAGPLGVLRAVFWSFFGVRRGEDLEADVASITPVQAIVGGLLGAALLVAALLALVFLVTRG